MSAHPSTISRQLPTKAFAIMRTAVGAASLFFPSQSALLFGIGTIDHSRIVFRLFGARELVLGTLLWYCQSRISVAPPKINDEHAPSDEQVRQQDLRRLLWLGVIIDTIDVVSSAVCIAEGNLDGKAIWFVGGGAGAFAWLGMICVRALG